MLIRPRGAESGFGDYLERGIKAGRSQTRDELDTRIPLAGDLALFEEVVNSMQNEGERYMHLTFSFKEHSIPGDVLKNITEEFRQFAFSAYGSDEYVMYAEAHIPKILSYVDPDGVVRERLPHIHLGVVNENQLTGKPLLPFGKVSINQHFIDAFQEHINAKYGLSSPKDNPRIEIEDAADMLGRYGAADFYGQRNIDIKSQLAREILSGQIATFDDLKKAAGRYGEVGTGKKGRSDEYLKVYLPGQKGKNGKPVAMRLEKRVFSKEFLAKSPEERRKIVEAAIQEGYREAQQVKKEPAHVSKLLNEWHSTRARELKHIHFGSKFYKTEYKPADQQTRLQLLNKLDAEFNRQWRPSNEQRSKPITRIPPPFRRDRLHHLSELNVARDPGRSEVLLPGDVSAVVDNQQAGIHRELRRPDDWARGRLKEGVAQASNVIDFYRSDLAEAYSRAQDKEKYAEIRKHIDPELLLAYLTRSHGLNRSLYTISFKEDGTPRIGAGTKNYTPNDFLTKEMALPWKEAAPILREVYERQLGKEIVREAVRPSRGLWSEFHAYRKERAGQKAKAWEALRADGKAIRDDYRKAKNALDAKRGSMTTTERKAALSVIKMEKAQQEKALIESKAALREQYQDKPVREHYRDWLQSQAQAGNGAALDELRRQCEQHQGEDERANAIKPAKPMESNHAPIRRLDYTVNQAGHVTYRMAGREALRDEGNRVAVLQENRDTILTAVLLAKEKFGGTLTLTGSDEFKRQVVETVVRERVTVQFADPQLEQLRQQLAAAEQAKQRERYEPAKPKNSDNSVQKHPEPAPQIEQPKPAIEIQPDPRRDVDEWLGQVNRERAGARGFVPHRRAEPEELATLASDDPDAKRWAEFKQPAKTAAGDVALFTVYERAGMGKQPVEVLAVPLTEAERKQIMKVHPGTRLVLERTDRGLAVRKVQVKIDKDRGIPR